MPVEVAGLKELQVAMRSFQPDLAKELKADITKALKPIVKNAQGYVPSQISGLSNWTFQKRSISAKSSAFRTGFPMFNSAEVKRGIKSQVFPTKPNPQGFISLVRIVNKSAAGAIYETAGRKNPWGQPWNPKAGSHNYSHSRNPSAGLHFNNSMGKLYGSNKNRGRLIYRAWDEDQGRTLAYIVKSVETVSRHFGETLRSGSKVFRKVA